VKELSDCGLVEGCWGGEMMEKGLEVGKKERNEVQCR